MKIVILAAGKGSRLGNPNLPKPLTLLTDESSILLHQLNNLTQYFSIDDIIIVIGYKKELIMEAIPNLLYIYNSHFEQENTSKSLLRAFRKINDDILWLNGDVVFDPKILKIILEQNNNLMIVN